MKKELVIILILSIVAFAKTGCASDKSVDFYVSPNGSDMNDGSLKHPFQTLERAKSAIWQAKNEQKSPTQQYRVYLRQGDYRLSTALVVRPEDSGDSGCPVVYTSYPNEQAVIKGSAAVKNWKVYKGAIYMASIPESFLTTGSFEQLYYKGESQIRARVPNRDPDNPLYGGYTYVNKAPDPNNLSLLTYNASDFSPETWNNPQTGIVDIFCYPNYGNRRLAIEKVNLKDHQLKVGKPGLEGWTSKEDRFFVENIFEELDSPGEWFLDEKTQLLYFWPPDGKCPGDTEVEVPVTDSIIEFKGTSKKTVQYVKLERLTLQQCKKSAVKLKACEDCSVQGCRIMNTGSMGIDIHWPFSSNMISDNDLMDLGNSGIGMMGHVLSNEKMSQNVITNNHITRIGQVSCMQVGGILLVAGSHNTISHNLIHDTPRWGIILDVSNDTIVEYNHVYQVNQITEDAGGINTGTFYGGQEKHHNPDNQDHVRRNIIRYNLVHDTGGYGRSKWWPEIMETPKGQWRTPYFSFGIYLDLASSGTHVYGNIVYNSGNGSVCIGGGKDNLIENNIFVGGYVAPVVSVKWPKHFPMANNKVERNVIYFTWPRAYLYANGQQADVPWQSSDISFNHNLIWHNGLDLNIQMQHKYGLKDWDWWQKQGMDVDSMIADPMFVDVGDNNYQLKPDSPALKIGFKHIPVEKIGLYENLPYRNLNN